ncbi:hypothetical protein ADK75_23340 [Streptomyces virginiae]|uniref:Peptidase inhibitor family I36 protein n=1 Tax=Streptomyces virginiae TaxID=1961 RepID=A0A0L8MAM2_STRVG|nr:peptidase inhibitor family I36 protein [Streptomyces virginiae]KOG47433.1 hypothetical protein ADK75_23340 [Streptomyces virginiae]
MKKSRLITSAATALLVLTAGLAAATPAGAAGAADCPVGEFCAWTELDYAGHRAGWAGDDSWWDGFIADQDSSWANHAVSGPGIADHVKVYEDTNTDLDEDMTICLAPGQEISGNATANDRGDSHTWATSC